MKSDVSIPTIVGVNYLNLKDALIVYTPKMEQGRVMSGFNYAQRNLYMKSVAIDCRTFRIPTNLKE